MAPSEELHDNERLVVLLADFVDGADVGVIERGGGAGLATKAFEGLRIAGQIRQAGISGRRSGPRLVSSAL